MALHFKIDDVLSDDERREFLAFVLQRSTTVDKAGSWLFKRGHRVSRGSVHNWMRKVRAETADPTLTLRAAVTARVQTMTAEQLQSLVAALGPDLPKIPGTRSA